MSSRYGCWSRQARAHPWYREAIPDCACGYDARMHDRACSGCHRQRAESALDQLKRLNPKQTEDGLTR